MKKMVSDIDQDIIGTYKEIVDYWRDSALYWRESYFELAKQIHERGVKDSSVLSDGYELV